MEPFKIVAVACALLIMAAGSFSSPLGTEPNEERRQKLTNAYLASILVLMFALVLSV